jgi:hypothetical protein
MELRSIIDGMRSDNGSPIQLIHMLYALYVSEIRCLTNEIGLLLNFTCTKFSYACLDTRELCSPMLK